VRAAAALAALLAIAGCSGERTPPGPLELLHARAAHTATALVDGRVLLAGGCVTAGCGAATGTTELFDGRRFQPGPRLQTPRDGHTATRLPDGSVLLAGGHKAEGTPPLASAEQVTASGSRLTGPMTTGRGGHVAVGLITGAGGRGGLGETELRQAVLVAGGSGPHGPLRSAEVYDAGRGVWRRVAPMHHARVAAAVAVLPLRRVLVTGGMGADGKALASAEIFDLNTETWTDAEPMLAARGKHAAVALGEGRVLVLGGARDDGHDSALRSAEVYDIHGRGVEPGWRSVGRMTAARYKIPGAVATRSDGQVVVAGDAPSAERFEPGPDRFSHLAGNVPGELFATVTALPDGHVLVAGGYDSEIDPTSAAEIVG
jgi:Kelch motif